MESGSSDKPGRSLMWRFKTVVSGRLRHACIFANKETSGKERSIKFESKKNIDYITFEHKYPKVALSFLERKQSKSQILEMFKIVLEVLFI